MIDPADIASRLDPSEQRDDRTADVTEGEVRVLLDQYRMRDDQRVTALDIGIRVEYGGHLYEVNGIDGIFPDPVVCSFRYVGPR